MNELYPYYERELNFMRDMAGEFARNYPEAASRLDIERHRCEDPHVERLIEAFSLIAARIHYRLDADFPEVTQAFLNLIFPDYLRPIPSMSIAQFQSADDSLVPESGGLVIPAGEVLPVGDVCQFRTCYPVEVWPIEVKEAAVFDTADLPGWATQTGATSAIFLRLGCKIGFRQLLGFRKLRFYFTGTTHIPFSLHELIFNHCYRVVARDPKNSRSGPVELPCSCLGQVGFRPEEAVIPYSNRSFLGFRCLHEYFSFPDKFLFADLEGMDEFGAAGFQTEAEILFLLQNPPRHERFQRLRFATTAENFQLGCSPVINLVGKLAEPIRVDQLRTEYRIVPDAYRPSSLEVYSIDKVTSRSFASRSTRIYRPFFSLDHSENGNFEETFWHAVRRRSEREGDAGTEIDLSLVDSKFRPTKPPDETLLVRLTCTNRDVPADLALRFDFRELTFPDSRVKVRLVQRPTQSLRPPLERNLDWRVISHLGLNYLSLVGPGTNNGDHQSAQALREMLELYNFSDDPAIHKRILGVHAVQSHPHRARVKMRRGQDVIPVFCHGMSVSIDFDQEPFIATGLFLFACVLERFLALYSSVNSFTQVTATTDEGRRVLKQWPPRNGEHILL